MCACGGEAAGASVPRRLLLFEPHGPLRDAVAACVSELGYRAEIGPRLWDTLARAEEDAELILLVELCQDCIHPHAVSEVSRRLAALERVVLIVETVAAAQVWRSYLPEALFLNTPFELCELFEALSAVDAPLVPA
ncbi:MAG: hypothetical protein JO023_07290 [Chloroflexi bacterium]|nr:hypothetical protein [Chloroflexota bacterium]